MSESLADRIRKQWDVSDSHRLIQEVRAMEEQLMQLKAHSEQVNKWALKVDAVNKMIETQRDELKAQLEDCTAVNAEVMKKVARLEKSINIQETDSN
jgi:ABC-type transporter Mla subunit MlaD